MKAYLLCLYRIHVPSQQNPPWVLGQRHIFSCMRENPGTRVFQTVLKCCLFPPGLGPESCRLAGWGRWELRFKCMLPYCEDDGQSRGGQALVLRYAGSSDTWVS